MAKHQMKLFDTSTWEARELTAPDGRTFVPSTLSEEKNLIAAHGYRFSDQVTPEGEADLQVAPAAPADAQTAPQLQAADSTADAPVPSSGKSGGSRKASTAATTPSE